MDLDQPFVRLVPYYKNSSAGLGRHIAHPHIQIEAECLEVLPQYI